MTDALTITDLYPDIYKKMDVVSREMIGLLPAISVDANMDRVAKNQPVRTFVTRTQTADDFAPGQLAPTAADRTVDNVTVAVTKERIINIVLDGNNQRRLNSSYGYREWLLDEIEQGLRTLTNEMEADVAGLYAKASRAVDPAGSTLFDAANYKDVANVRQILAENGAPLNDVSLVLSPTAAAAFRGNAQYYGANTSGNETYQRQGLLMNIHGINIRESQQIATHTPGTAASTPDTNATGYAVGSTVIGLDASAPSGTGTFVAGDRVSFGSDPNEYVVVSGDSDISDGGSITIAAPGLKVAIPAAETVITLHTDTEMNMCFARNAIHLVHRLLPIPQEGDAAVQSMVIRDRLSGMNFDLRQYNEFGQVRWILGCSWGYEMIKPEHAALLVD